MKRLVLSAPFGNYLAFPNATSTLGTFTLRPRGGLGYRLWRCLLTLRPKPSLGGWVNRLGLPNPGVDSLRSSDSADKIVSVHGFDQWDWVNLVWGVADSRPLAVELNLSCPNVGRRPEWRELAYAVREAHTLGLSLVAKLPPIRWAELAEPLFDTGVTRFHCCNTIKTPGGGLSGETLRQYSLWAVSDLKDRWGDRIEVIGGGGIKTLAHVEEYRNAGADHFAVGSALLNPFRWRGVKSWDLESAPRHAEVTT